jgi:response regulator RpfG family c-di-GMP phosphodiesterase
LYKNSYTIYSAPPVIVDPAHPFAGALKVIVWLDIPTDFRYGGGCMGKKPNVKDKARKKVLIIQGMSPLMNIAGCLTRAGFYVATIPNLPETLVSLSIFRSDIVVINDTMVTGIETYHHTRDIINAPVMLVGRGNLRNTSNSILSEAGADDYIIRSFDDEALITRVRATLIPCLDDTGDSSAIKRVKGRK